LKARKARKPKDTMKRKNDLNSNICNELRAERLAERTAEREAERLALTRELHAAHHADRRQWLNSNAKL
jgi:hypothetical protein